MPIPTGLIDLKAADSSSSGPDRSTGLRGAVVSVFVRPCPMDLDGDQTHDDVPSPADRPGA